MSSSPSSSCSMEQIDLSTTVGGISLCSCIYNASGPRSGTVEALQKVAACAGAGAVLSKSATLRCQTGNPLPRIHHEEYASFNSEGLPNQGIDYYIQGSNIRDIVGAGNKTSPKPYIVSLSGQTLEDNVQMLEKIVCLSDEDRRLIAGIELNLACPNIIGKPTLAYDMEQLQSVLERVDREFGKHYAPRSETKMPVFGVKLPPYLDMIQLQQVATILNPFADTILRYITTMNTMGNALAIDLSVQQPFISANQGLAGMSGRSLKATALANVWKFRQALRTEIDVVGVGGIETGEDVIRMLLAGAKAVQIGTVHWTEGPACFDRIASETRAWLAQHNYASVQQVYNQLKPWSKERAQEARLLKRHHQEQQTTATTTTTTKNTTTTTTTTTTAESAAPVQSNEAQFWKLVSAVLMVIVALLLADKFHGNLLPSEAA